MTATFVDSGIRLCQKRPADAKRATYRALKACQGQRVEHATNMQVCVSVGRLLVELGENDEAVDWLGSLVQEESADPEM